VVQAASSGAKAILTKCAELRLTDRIPPRFRERYHELQMGPGCGRICRQGSHPGQLQVVVADVAAVLAASSDQ